MKNRDIYDKIKSEQIGGSELVNRTIFHLVDMEVNVEVVDKVADRFVRSYRKKMKDVNKNHSKFLKKFENWLDETLDVSLNKETQPSQKQNQGPGRPRTDDLEESSIRTKLRRSVEAAEKSEMSNYFWP